MRQRTAGLPLGSPPVEPTNSPEPPAPLPMFERPSHPDGHHRVTAPGGYEWWYFDAESPDGRDRFVAILFEGFVFHPGYLRRDAAFRKQPTKVPPVTGRDFPCAYCCTYRDGKIVRQFMTQVKPDAFDASPDEPRVRVGDCTLEPVDGGLRLKLSGTPWHLTARGPQLDVKRTLTADVTFRPTLENDPAERVFLSREMTGEHHGWIPAAPRCEVTGTVDGKPFSGRGYHDHNYGTGPLDAGLKRWIWGRVLTDDGTTSFHVAEARDAKLPREEHFFRLTAGGFEELPTKGLKLNWSRKSGAFLPYPAAVDFPGKLSLTSPTIVDASPFYLRLTYRATLDGRPARDAFCEVGHPGRLRWPILGRMIEMSVDKRQARP